MFVKIPFGNYLLQNGEQKLQGLVMKGNQNLFWRGYKNVRGKNIG